MKALLQRWLRRWDALLDALLAPEFVAHETTREPQPAAPPHLPRVS